MARGLYWAGLPRTSHSYSRSPGAPPWSWMSRFSENKEQFDSHTDYRTLTDTFMCDERLVISHSAPRACFGFGPCRDIILDVTAAVIPAPISIVGSKMEWDRYYINLQQLTWTKQHFILWADYPGPSCDDLGNGDECLRLLLGRNSGAFHDCVVVCESA
jgi:hypothetical protein